MRYECGKSNKSDRIYFSWIFWCSLSKTCIICDVSHCISALSHGKHPHHLHCSHGFHTPNTMYIFLGNLSFLEIWYTTATVPKLLATCLSQVVTISVAGCITQYYFFFSMGATECILLAVMAYDRYLAICSPLRYAFLMSLQVCLWFSVGSWIGGFIAPVLPTVLVSYLNFCSSQKINHFFCDSEPIFQLSCSDTFLVEALGYTCTSVVILSSFLLTMSSYGHIVVTIIKLSSREARKKTFSTCASHLTVVTIYYGTIIFAYVRHPAKYNFTMGKVISVFYCVVTPLVNPLVYTLRNKDVKKAFRKVLARKRLLLARHIQNI